MLRIVRITRIWDVEVEAQYGDHDDDIIERAKAGVIADAIETRTLIPDDRFQPMPAPPPEPGMAPEPPPADQSPPDPPPPDPAPAP